MPVSPEAKLLADIGGSYARFAIERADGELSDAKALPCADYPDFLSALRAYIEMVGAGDIRHGAIAIANPVEGDLVRMTNYHWQFSTSVQHELLPKVAVNVGYFRTWWKNFTATDNLANLPANSTQVAPRSTTGGTTGARATRAPTATPKPTRTGGNGNNTGGVQSQGLALIAMALVGLGVLGGVAWRILRRPSGPGDSGGPRV